MSPVYHQEGRGDHADAAVLWLPGQLEQHWSVVLVLALSLQSAQIYIYNTFAILCNNIDLSYWYVTRMHFCHQTDKINQLELIFRLIHSVMNKVIKV